MYYCVNIQVSFGLEIWSFERLVQNSAKTVRCHKISTPQN